MRWMPCCCCFTLIRIVLLLPTEKNCRLLELIRKWLMWKNNPPSPMLSVKNRRYFLYSVNKRRWLKKKEKQLEPLYITLLSIYLSTNAFACIRSRIPPHICVCDINHHFRIGVDWFVVVYITSRQHWVVLAHCWCDLLRLCCCCMKALLAWFMSKCIVNYSSPSSHHHQLQTFSRILPLRIWMVSLELAY